MKNEKITSHDRSSDESHVADNVVLFAPENSVTTRLVRSLHQLVSEDVGPLALIGGLSVTCRLGTVHRATSDVDALSLNDGGTGAVAILEERGHRVVGPTVEVNGTVLDVIDVFHVEDKDLPTEPLEKLFLVSHWWAFNTAEPVTIHVMDGLHIVAEATVMVATPAALIAMKLSSYPNRRDDRVHKQGGDALDLYLLLRNFNRNGELAALIAAAPAQLGQLCLTLAEEILVDDAVRTARALRTATGMVVSEDDILSVGEPFVEMLSELLDV